MQNPSAENDPAVKPVKPYDSATAREGENLISLVPLVTAPNDILNSNPNDETKVDGDILPTSGPSHIVDADAIELYDVIEPPVVQASPVPSWAAAHWAKAKVIQEAIHKAKIEAPGLLDDFDEDADFSEAPADGNPASDDVKTVKSDLDTASGTDSAKGWSVFAPGKNAPPFVPDKTLVGPISLPIAATIGGGLVIIGAILAALRADQGMIYASLSVLYLAGIHSITGVAAAMVGALDARARVGNLVSAWGRMFITVAAVLVTVSIPLDGAWRALVVAPAALAIYGLCLVVLFRWKFKSILVVSSAHFGLWFVIYLGQILHGAMAVAATAK